MKKLNYKYVIIAVILLMIVIISVLFIKNKINNTNKSDLDNVYPGNTGLVEINMGTYYNESQIDYCKIKIPGNYSGWAMYLNSENENKNFEMANSHELSYSIENGLLEKEEAIQQFHYSNVEISKEESTNIYANIFTSDQIKYEDMKNQTLNAKEISDIAFYSTGDKKYTNIDVTLYYKINDNIMLQLSYKGPQTTKLGHKKIANELYELIEVID